MTKLSRRALLASLLGVASSAALAGGTTRSPIYARAFSAALAPPAPLKIPTNRYPHSTHYYDGHVYLSSVGGNFDYPGGTVWVSGNAKVEKFNCLTGAKVGETIIGLYESAPGSGVYLHGCSGLCDGAGSIWVSQSGGTAGIGEIIRIDPVTMAIQARIPVPGRAIRDAFWDTVNDKVWATCGEASKIVRIDPATNTIDLPVNTAAMPFRGACDGTSLWVACFTAGVVQKINPTSGAIIKTIATGANANSVWCETDRVFVANYASGGGTGSITMIDPVAETVIWTIDIGPWTQPHGMVLVDQELWICCSGDHYIRILNVVTKQWVRNIKVPDNPPWPCFDGSNVWHASGNYNVLLRHPVKSVW